MRGEGGGVRTDGGEGVVLLGHRRQWVWDHFQPCALAIHQGGGLPQCHSLFGCHVTILVMWHLQMPPPFSFCCDVALVMLAVVIVGMGNRCEWQPLVMVMVMVVKQE